MGFDSINYELFIKARDISREIEEFMDLSNDVDGGINVALDYLGKAKEVLDDYLNNAEGILDEITSELYTCPMYGSPEILFAKKDRTEEILKNELLTEVNNKKILATQWKEIVKQIIEAVPEGRETIKRIINE